jgi:formate hydrogenlyase subunit 3/multisubunit Na+/H+ antiporter MnhD subunit
MIVLMLAVPVVAALSAWLFRHLRTLAATLATAGVLGLAFLALLGIETQPLVVLGRTLALGAAVRVHLAFVLALLAVAMACTARLAEQDSSWSLALLGVGLLVGYLSLASLTLATLTLMAALVVLAMLIPLKAGDLAPVNVRALVVLVMAGVLALAAAWLIEHPADVAEGAPSFVGPAALVSAYGAMLGVFPFFVWILPVYRAESSLARVMLGVAVPHLLLISLMGLQATALGPSAMLLPTLALNLGIATFAVGCIGALSQRSVSGMLGYMAMSELGVVLMAMGAGIPANRALAVAHLLSRGVGVVAMSVGVGVLRHSFAGDALGDVQGAVRRAPMASLAILLAGLSLAGFPPMAGFVTRFALYRAIAIENVNWAVMMAVLGLAPTLAVMRFAVAAFQVTPVPGTRREPRWPAALALILSLGLVVWGLFPQALAYLPARWSDLLLGLAGLGG